MKIRMDFVTNSSSSSYIAFTIKNIPLFNALTKLGITFPRAKNGMFTDGLKMTLPSGLTASPHFSDSDRHFLSSGFDSILEWLRAVWFDEPDGGGLVVDANKDSCKNGKDNDDIDDDDGED